jgi:hypothetical protein
MTIRRLAWTLTVLVTNGCRDEAASVDDGETGSDGGTAGSTSTTDATTDGETTGEPDVACTHVGVGPTPLQRLTRAQYVNAVGDLLGVEVDPAGLDGDEKVGPFAANVSALPSEPLVQQYRILAEQTAQAAMPKLQDIVGCNTAHAECTDAFVRAFGRRAFRRPLSDDEVARYGALFALGDDGIDGARVVVSAMLQSPLFLYRPELGVGDPHGEMVPLEAYEIASRLSFFLWDSIPDDALLDAAAAGEIDDVDGIEYQVTRMLSDGRARRSVGSFHRQWLALDELATATKDPEHYPSFDDAMRTAMWDETRRFAEQVILAGDGRFETLMTASWSYVDGPLFGLYGIAAPPGHTPGMPVDLDPAERGGLLTHASFLATHAHADQSGPVQRGVVVLTNLFCAPPPAPPPTVNAVPPAVDPDATTREQYAMHAQAECAGCHQLIDGVGFGFEAYDGIGGFRATQNGKAIDVSGELVGTDVDGPFVGTAELAARIVDSEQAQRCLVRQWFRFALARVEHDDDACTVEQLHTRLVEQDGNVHALLVAIATSEGFRHRRTP